MTVEEFIKENWEEFLIKFDINKVHSVVFTHEWMRERQAKFWIEKAKEYYHVELLEGLAAYKLIESGKTKSCKWTIGELNSSSIEISKKFEPSIEIHSKLEWQPAETAPKDGSYFFSIFVNKVLDESPLEIYICKKSEEVDPCYFWETTDSYLKEENLKYWLPLSALPPIPENKNELVLEARKFYKLEGGNKFHLGYISPLRTAEYPYIGEALIDDKWEPFITKKNLILSEWEE